MTTWEPIVADPQRCEWPGGTDRRGGSRRACELPAGHPPNQHHYGRCDVTPGCRFAAFHDRDCWTGPRALPEVDPRDGGRNDR